jgi:anthranilate 1,2-dioxygenase ferredoxin subunit
MPDLATLVLVCRLDEVSEDEPLSAKVGRETVAVFLAMDQYFVTSDLCSHGPGYLSEGNVEGFEIECPFHQGRFDLRTGVPTLPPCTLPVKTWKPHIIDGGLYIDLDDPSNREVL